MGNSSSGLQPGASIREDYGGLGCLRMLNRLSQTDNLEGVIDKLRRLSEVLLSKSRMRVAINASKEHIDEVTNLTGAFLGSVPGSFESFEPVSSQSFVPSFQDVYISTPFPVHFCSTSVATVPYSHPDLPALRILARFLSTKFLHTEIREKGGAYGGGASISPESGIFSFYSYRDPRFRETLDIFDRSASWVKEHVIADRDLDEAKLGVFQRLDAPVVPGDRGMREFLSGIDADAFESHRNALKAVTAEDLERVAEKYLKKKGSKATTVIGPEPKGEALDVDGWKVTQLV